MEITHGIALLFAVIFTVIGAIFKKLLWWLLSIGYLACLAFMAIYNSWELLFFPVIAILAIISLIALIFTAVRGDII